MSATEQLKTATGAHHAIQRGEFGRKVIDEVHTLYHLHEQGPCVGNCGIVPADFKIAAERIVQLEEALRERDNTIVELHDEVAHWRDEAAGAYADAAYWEGKASDAGS